MTLALLMLACGTAPSEGPAAAPAPPVEAAEAAPPAPVPARGGVRVLHHRMAKGQRTPSHVSATWLDSGLQMMITGFDAPCEPAPSFTLVAAGDTFRLVELDPGAKTGKGACTGSHTMMLQIDDLSARDLTVQVGRHDGKDFGSTEVRSTDH